MKTARDYWKERFDEYPVTDADKLAVAMMTEYLRDCHASHPSPMSAEQVAQLFDNKSDCYADRDADYVVHAMSKAKFIEVVTSLPIPSVKADGWVSVEEKKRLEQIIELKEKERQEWANMCISKQKRIDELENPLKAAPPNVNN